MIITPWIISWHPLHRDDWNLDPLSRNTNSDKKWHSLDASIPWMHQYLQKHQFYQHLPFYILFIWTFF